jgi:hypothetical protein
MKCDGALRANKRLRRENQNPAASVYHLSFIIYNLIFSRVFPGNLFILNLNLFSPIVPIFCTCTYI